MLLREYGAVSDCCLIFIVKRALLSLEAVTLQLFCWLSTEHQSHGICVVFLKEQKGVVIVAEGQTVKYPLSTGIFIYSYIPS